MSSGNTRGNNSRVWWTLCKSYYNKTLPCRKPHDQETLFLFGMFWVAHKKRKRITKNSSCFNERYPMLL